MTRHPALLFNHHDVELWPSRLLRARGNADARQLAQARWLLRRKRDGQYLATLDATGRLQPMRADSLDTVDRKRLDHWLAHAHATSTKPACPARPLPLHGLEARLAALGLDARAYAEGSGLALVAEPEWLALAGFDRYRRPLWLQADAARAWLRMQHAAAGDGIVLDAISGWRSHDYQLGIFQRKRARGQSVEQILTVNAAPGFSEHHGGRALDIGTPGEPPAEESFEATAAFHWLCTHACAHGFTMSYPRDNPHGIVYEPWHWAWHGAVASA